MERFNQACSLAEQAFEMKTANKIALQPKPSTI
jgi:hypothetical protein